MPVQRRKPYAGASADERYNQSTMEEYSDEICLFALCSILVAIMPLSPFSVIGFLGAVIMVCATNAKRGLRLATQAAFLVCTAASGACFAFVPVAAYCTMHEKPWGIRLLWVAPLIVRALLAGFTVTWFHVLIVCCVGCILAIRDARAKAERQGIMHAYDGLREHVFAEQEAEAHKAVSQERVPVLFEGLTKRETAVAQLVAEGMDNREISQRLFLSEGTVRNHISAILAKKDLTNRTQIAVLYYRS